MEENLKIDRDYKEAFNQGYELAKELKLASPMFKNPNSNSNGQIMVIQEGMAQYITEVTAEKKKNIVRASHLKKNIQKNNKDSGLNLSS